MRYDVKLFLSALFFFDFLFCSILLFCSQPSWDRDRDYSDVMLRDAVLLFCCSVLVSTIRENSRIYRRNRVLSPARVLVQSSYKGASPDLLLPSSFFLSLLSHLLCDCSSYTSTLYSHALFSCSILMLSPHRGSWCGLVIAIISSPPIPLNYRRLLWSSPATVRNFTAVDC